MNPLRRDNRRRSPVWARLLGGKPTELWKQQVIVDNRGGANGIVGTKLVARSAPDGYTMLYVNRRP